MKKPLSTTILMRGDWRIEIATTEWAELLLFLSKQGWQPSIPTHSLLASYVSVSNEDATSLADSGQKILDEAMRNPLTFYPVPFDMGKMAEILCFCEEGAFQLQNVKKSR